MEITPPKLSRLDSGGTAVTYDLFVREGALRDISFRTSEPVGAVGIEPLVCLSLVPAMRTGQDIASGSPVSARMAAALPKIQSIFRGWYPLLRPVTLRAPTHDSSGRPDRGVGCFFSGGVDSFYSVLQHAGEVDTLIFVHGFDFPLAKTEFRQRVSAEMRNVAGALGKRLIEVETDLRDWIEPYGHWGNQTHGAGLVAVAHLLAGTLRKVYVPSSSTKDAHLAWGSHPVLDPLWSTEAMEIVHDDDLVTRFDKTAHVASSDVAVAHLRVCWASRGDAYNCGRCEKCLRTMMSLRLVGALDRCRTFEAPLDLSLVPPLKVTSRASRRFYREILDAARAAGDREVIRAVQPVMSTRRRVRHWLGKHSRRLRQRFKPVVQK